VQRRRIFEIWLVEDGAMGRGRQIVLALWALAVVSMRGASGTESVSAVYAFSWAGLDVGRLEVLLRAEDGDYRASWEAGTSGLVGTLFPFSSRGMAEGRREGERYLPSLYGGQSRWRDGGSQWRVVFAEDGRATTVEAPADDLGERELVPTELRVGPDPASLALAAIARAAPGIRLDGQSFDGRRATRVELSCDAAPAAGTAELACTISGRLIAGASRRWRERSPSEAEREPWRVWLREGVHGDGFWPVRLEAPSRVGTVAARLISIGRPPAAG
jgi:Protein of unknown function (DUF3108)